MPIRSAIRLGVQLARSTGAFVSGRDFIQRNVPPRYRPQTLRVFKAFEQAATGAGLYKVYQTLLASEDGLGNDAISKFPQKQPKTYKSNKTRYRSARRFGCRCPTGIHSNRKQRFSGSGKYQRMRNRF